ncbi:hypothetical protein SK128_016289, partial [Halocaridina rubra]
MDLIVFSVLSIGVVFGLFMVMYVVICISLCRDAQCSNMCHPMRLIERCRDFRRRRTRHRMISMSSEADSSWSCELQNQQDLQTPKKDTLEAD